MLARSHRLPSSYIPDVMRYGRRTAGEAIQVIVQKNEADVSRFAYIVSTKIDKRATARNRMKRLISESIFRLLPRLLGSFDCVVVVRRDFSGKLQTEVELMISQVMEKAGLLK